MNKNKLPVTTPKLMISRIMKTGIKLCLAMVMMFHLANAQKEKKQMEKETMVSITTDLGTIKVKLYNQTPQHRDNFIKLANEGTLNGTIFHRVIKGFMIQGGDPNSKDAKPGQMLGNGDVGYTIPAEFNPALNHIKGALSAARTENPQKASSGCQFYIVQGKPATDAELTGMETRLGIKYSPENREVYKTQGGTPFLDMNYTVFGQVVEGLDIVDKIAATEIGPNDRPVKDIKMTVKVIE